MANFVNFFFVPRSRHADYSIFSYFLSELKIQNLYLLIILRDTFDITDPSSMQNAWYHEAS